MRVALVQDNLGEPGHITAAQRHDGDADNRRHAGDLPVRRIPRRMQNSLAFERPQKLKTAPVRHDEVADDDGGRKAVIRWSALHVGCGLGDGPPNVRTNSVSPSRVAGSSSPTRTRSREVVEVMRGRSAEEALEPRPDVSPSFLHGPAHP